jgi:hypothetical protein
MQLITYSSKTSYRIWKESSLLKFLQAFWQSPNSFNFRQLLQTEKALVQSTKATFHHTHISALKVWFYSIPTISMNVHSILCCVHCCLLFNKMSGKRQAEENMYPIQSMITESSCVHIARNRKLSQNTVHTCTILQYTIHIYPFHTYFLYGPI